MTTEDQPQPPAATEPASSETVPPAKGKKQKKKGRWWRRLKWTFIVLIALAILLRIALGFALPYVVNAAAKSVGMTAHYDNLNLSLAGGEATVWNLRVVPQDPQVSGGEPVFAANYLRGDISPLALLKGRLVVWRAEADTVDLRLERRADGSLPILLLVPPGDPAAPPPADDEPGAVSFTPPLALDALRLNRVRARILDAAVQPPLDTVVELNARVSKVGPDSPNSEIEIDIFAPPMMEVLKIRALARAHERELDSSLTIDLFGLRPGALAGYLAQLGLRPAAERLNAHMEGTLTTTAVEGDDRAVSAVLALREIVGDVDGRPELKVHEVRFEAPYVGPEGVEAEELLIEGARLSALRTSEGGIRALGVELPTTPPESPAMATPHSTANTADPVAEAEATQPSGDAMTFRLARLAVRDARATFRDEAVEPPVQLAGQVLELSVRDLSWPPAAENAAIAFDASLAAPGVARSLLASGSLQPFAEVQVFSADVAADGIRPEAVEPYLRQAGVESLLEDGRFAARLQASVGKAADGSPSISAVAREIDFSDAAAEGARQLIGMSEASVAGLAMLEDGTLRVDEVLLRGPALDVHLGADGAVSAAGFRTIPPVATGEESAKSAANGGAGQPEMADSASTPVEPALRAVDLGHLSWEGLALTLTDAAAEPAMVTRLADVSVDIRDLRVDLVAPGEGADASRAGNIAVRVSAPELVEQFEAGGTLAASAGTLEARIDFTGSGMTLDALRPMLARSGIEPEWARSDLKGTLSARAVPVEGAAIPRLDVNLENVSLSDGPTELAGLDRLRVDQFVSGSDGTLRVESVEVARPRITGRRAADGTVVLAGVRFNPAPPAGEEARTAAAAIQPGDGPEEAAPAAAFPFGPLVLPRVVIGGLEVTEASFACRDETRTEAFETELFADVDVGRLDTTEMEGADTPFTVVVRAAGLDALSLAGQVHLQPDEQRLTADVSADGVDGRALAALMPPGIELAVSDGALRVHAEAQLLPGLAEGGLGAQLSLTGLDWRDSGGARVLASMEALEVQIDRFDPAGNEVVARQVRVANLASGARLGADGSKMVAGIKLLPAAAALPGEAIENPAAAAAGMEGGATEQDAHDEAAEGVRAGLGRSARAGALPRVSLEELDLHLARFEVIDEARPESAPLVLQDVRLASAEPIRIDPAQGDSDPPIRLGLTGAALPVVGAFRVDVASQPLARSPTANVSLRVEGIDGEGVLALMPELAEQVDASELTDGRFALDLEGRAEVQWREGMPDFGSGIGGELLVRDISFSNGEGGPVLLGLDELEADRIRFEPSSGGLVIGSLELRTPRGHFALDDRGLHAAGLVYLMNPDAPPTTEASPEPATAPIAPVVAEAEPVDPGDLPPEIRIDSLRVSGADLTFEDRTAEPPLVAPITNLDVDVRGLSNRLATQPGALRFSIMANAGQVELPRPPEGSGIAGAIGDVGRLLGGAQREEVASTATERRDLFAQFSTTGRLQLHPAPDGRVNLSLSGLEVLSLRGLAQTQGIVISNGVFDLDADLRLNPDNSIEVRSKSDFTSLRVSEPANGPIYQYLRLPAPLDTVIVTLQDAGGTISLPISVTLQDGQLGGTGELVGSIVSALSQVIAKAIVESPMKVAGGGLAMIGISQGQRGFQKRSVELSFEPGSTELDSASRRRLAAVQRLLRSEKEAKAALRHRLGAADLPLVAQRANPTPEEALAVASRLRDRRDQLLERRPQLVGAARSAIAFGTPEEAQAATTALRDLDVEAAELDASIDSALELLSPGAPRRADRRIRTTAISLGEQRLRAVQTLLAGQTRTAGSRIQLANAQFDPPDAAQAASQPARAEGGIIEIELVYPR